MQEHPSAASPGAELLDRIVRLNRWVTRHTAWTLPLAQARVLSLIDELETARIGDLARAERCTQPTMTTQVHRLEAQGLVSRAPDPDDARAARISLTARGRHALAEIRQAEHDVAILIQLGSEPDAFTEGIEELHDRDVILIALATIGQQAVVLCACQEDHAAALRSVSLASDSPVSSASRCDSSQSAALLACEAARTIARESSRMTSSHDPM